MSGYKPAISFVFGAGESLSAAVIQRTRQALIGIQSTDALTGAGSPPSGDFVIQFRGAMTLNGDYLIIKNSSGVVTVTATAGAGYSHPLDPADFAAFEYIKAEIVDEAEGSGVGQDGGVTIAGTLYEV